MYSKSNIFLVVMLFMSLFSFDVHAHQLVCQRMVDAAMKDLGINSEDVKAITDNECDDDNFAVEFKVIKPFKIKGVQVDPNMEMSIFKHALSSIERKDGKPIVIDDKVSCLVRASYDFSPNRFCECIIAKPITFDKVTLPKGSTAQFNEKMDLASFKITSEINVNGKKFSAGNYILKNGIPVKNENTERDPCPWD